MMRAEPGRKGGVNPSPLPSPLPSPGGRGSLVRPFGQGGGGDRKAAGELGNGAASVGRDGEHCGNGLRSPHPSPLPTPGGRGSSSPPRHTCKPARTRRLALLLSLLLLPIPALAQSGATRFQLAVPGYAFDFPRDHGAHDEFRTEWWYFTGHLRHDSGERFGYELTFFRHRIDDTTRTFEPNPSAWAAGNVFFAHFAVTDMSRGRFVYETRLHRPAAGLAGASATDCHVFIEDWTLDREGEGFRLHARGADYAIELDLAAVKPLVIQGVDGVSQKSDGFGQASHYISFTRLDTSGRLRRDGQWFDVRGQSWMDHEFGSNQLGPNQIGWDWFSLQLDNGADIMLYEMRRDDGRRDPHSSGTWVHPSGEAEHLTGEAWSVRPKRFWTSPHTGAVYPMGWIVEIPGRELVLHVDPVLEDQELGDHNYWEGAVDLSGSLAGETVSGVGYVEMAGYAGRLRGL